MTTNWTQGATQSTGRSTDFMIEGDGFFITRNSSGEQLFTRAGSFDFDGAGKLVTPDGSVLQGWMANGNGQINTNGPVGPLSVPYGQTVAPRASTSGSVVGNLASDAPVGTTVTTNIKMFDAQGVEQEVVYTFTKMGANDWDMDVIANGITLINDATVAFDASGALTTPAPPAPSPRSTRTPSTPPPSRAGTLPSSSTSPA
ncbi:flagellar hook-basal body complex protein [Blastococcus sp. PRF04-17]|uniref:flagellar hook-basal body complex protein n=1 Tax=Blastococcus sp. PRF04-17 TaxID=2933797 RepID=UPI0035304336